MTKAKPDSKRAKSQHYVPRLHLRRFLSVAPKNMIWTYDKQCGTVRPSRIEETGNQNNFYSVKREDGFYDDVLDVWLRGVENDAAAPYEGLLQGHIPTGQAKAEFSVFVSSLYARSPSLIRANARGYAQFLQHITDLQFGTRERFEASIDRYEAESGDRVDCEELFASWNDKDRFIMEISQKKGLSAFAVTDSLTKIFLSRHWYLIEAVGGYFITSDSPVFKFTDPDHWHRIYGEGGFLNPKAEVTVPLSPSLMLLIAGEKVDVGSFNVPAEMVWNLNGARAYGAERFLYSHVKDDRVAALAARHKDDPPERFVIEDAGPFHEVKVTR